MPVQQQVEAHTESEEEIEVVRPRVSELKQKLEEVIECKWIGPAYDCSGYGAANRGYLTALFRKGIFIELEAEYFYQGEGNVGPDPTIRNILDAMTRNMVKPTSPVVRDETPEFYERDEDRKANIGMTIFELSGIPPLWVNKINECCDELWVPNQFNRQIFQTSGVDVPIHLVPHGIDTKKYHPDVRPLTIHNTKGFTFLSVFQWTPRKGPNILMRAFFEEFSEKDDVCLLLRAFRSNSSYSEQAIIKREIKQYKQEYHPDGKGPRVVFIGDNVPDELMPSLYTAADCFVLPSRAEGWNMPAAEALACEVPVITTNWGGHLCFLNGRNSYLIDVEELELTHSMDWIPWYRKDLCLKWAVPSIDHLKKLMRTVVDNPKQAKKKAMRGRKLLQAYTWERSANIIKKRLIEYQ